MLPGIRFNNTSIRDILNSIANATGINVTYDRDYQDRAYTVQLNGVTLEQALNQILSANQLFYKVINERTIMVIADNAQKRANYEEQVIRTFYVSHADATELAQMINTIIRVPAMAVQPMIAPNKTSNTITIRATTAVAAIIEKMIEANDKPRAEIVIDVQILEINRGRAKTFGIDLSSYTIGSVFSPEADPRGGTGATTTFAPAPFNLNTITRGISTADFYLAVPSAVVQFLETDTETKLIAKPQLRGAEGQKITLNLGDQIPVPVHGVHAAGDRRREHEPADVVHLQGRRHQRRDDAARDGRRRHHSRPPGREQHARRGRQHRRAEPSVVRDAQGEHAPAPARRRIEPARRTAARGRAQDAEGSAGPDTASDSQQAVRVNDTEIKTRPTS